MSIDSVRGSQILSAVDHEPFQPQTTAYTRSLLVPADGRDGKQAQLSGEPMRTQTTRNETGLLVPAGGTWNDDARLTSDPMRALTTRDANALVTGPRDHMLMEYNGNGQVHRVSKAIFTITTHDRLAMITTLRGQNVPNDVGQPLVAFAANGLHHGLAEWKVPGTFTTASSGCLSPTRSRRAWPPEGIHHARQQTRAGQDGRQRRNAASSARPRRVHR